MAPTTHIGNDCLPCHPVIVLCFCVCSGKFEWNCWHGTDTRGEDMVCGEGLVMSRYNKAECIHAFVAAYQLQPKHIIFVDDFAQNAYNVAW